MLEWIKNIFFKNRDEEYEEEWDWGEPVRTPLDRRKMNLNDPDQLDEYVRECCEQIREANEEIDSASMEYRLVTERLTDIEEIEQVNDDDKELIEKFAQKIAELNQDRQVYKSRIGGMSDEKYRIIARFEDELPEAITELVKNEEYKELVKKDLQNLEGEKVSYRFRRRELINVQNSSRELAVIVIFAEICMMVLLAFLQMTMDFTVKFGYFLLVAIGCLALTLVFIRFQDAKKELRIVEKKINQAITVQNTVKIRYVNVTNLVEYSYTKFEVNSSKELDYLWQKYIIEKRERENLQMADYKLTKEQNALLEVLKRQRLRSPEIWINQAGALIDSREMVEIRHGLIVRRQSLRKRIEYNEKNRKDAKIEVTNLVEEYPEMAHEILRIVDKYD